MRKFTKSLFALSLMLFGWGTVNAATQIDGGLGNLVVPNTYENIGAWGGIWSGGFDYAVDGGKNWAGQDWSAYDYVWVKYSGLTGKINFGVTYSEFIADHGSWGEFVGASISLTGTSGIVGLKLNNTSVYVKGTAETDGNFIGDIYAKHIREIWIQSTENGSGVTLEEIWVGSKAEYMAAIGFDTSKNHMLLATNGAAKSNPWDYQVNYTLPTPLVKGKTYVIEYAINAVNGGETRVVPNGDGNQWEASKGLWTNEFTKYQVEFEANGNHTKLEIDLGACGGEVYIDNISLKEKNTDVNLIANGDFEELGLEGWSAAGNTIAQVEKEEPGEVLNPGILISVGEAGWKTFRTGSNVKITDPNVKAYVAKYVAEGNYVALTEVTEIPAWAPVIIEAPQGNYLVQSPESVSSFPANDLKANGGSKLSGDGTLYGLAKKNDVVGFYKIASTSAVPAWAIYLQIPAGGSAPEFLGFGGEATGIEAVKSAKNDGEFFNLAGQRVANPTKGLYIVNGKKYIVK